MAGAASEGRVPQRNFSPRGQARQPGSMSLIEGRSPRDSPHRMCRCACYVLDRTMAGRTFPRARAGRGNEPSNSPRGPRKRAQRGLSASARADWVGWQELSTATRFLVPAPAATPTLIGMTDNFLASQGGLLAQHRGLLAQQSGVITRGQALAAGFTDKAIEVRLATGRWQRLYPGVYATFSGEPSRAARLWAAVLRAGTGSALSHQTAAELYGLADSPAPLIHVTVPSGSAVVRPPGVLIH